MEVAGVAAIVGKHHRVGPHVGRRGDRRSNLTAFDQDQGRAVGRATQMRDNLICNCLFSQGPRVTTMTSSTITLNNLANGAQATVAGVVVASPEIDAGTLRRLGELGFIPGEPVQV